MNSGPYAAQGRGCRDEGPFRFLLHDGEKRVQILDALLGNCNCFDDFLTGHRNGLTHLLDIHPHRRRYVVHVVGDGARVTHQRIYVTVDAVEHVTDLRVALPEVPGGGYQSHCKNKQRDRSKTTGIRGDLLESA